MLHIHESKEGETVVLCLTGRLDAMTAPDLEKKMDVLLPGGRPVIVDCEQLEGIVSAGLRVFLAAAKKCKKAGGRVALCQMQPIVLEVFKISGFTEILAIFPTRDEAIHSMSP